MATMANFYRDPRSTITTHHDTYPYISPSRFTGSLKGKVILLTGAGRGIGRASALAFAAAGANVACISRTHSDTRSLVQEISDKGYPRAIAIAADVADADAPGRVVGEVQGELGPVDVLINNAGISRISDVEHEHGMGAAMEVVEVNVRGALNFIHTVIPSMIERKSGVIINVVSVLATISLPYFSAYSAAKAALIRSTHIMDLEFRPHGIYSYAVHPCMSKDTTLGEGALNLEAHEKAEGVKRFMEDFVPTMTDTVQLAANTFLALAADPDAKYMSGKYIDSTQDLGMVLEEARKGSESRIEREGLYILKVDTL
ncbi:MAG: hypothetical protein Q9161_006802 [Pseudevernia consocians]